jgi:hypothetical protein
LILSDKYRNEYAEAQVVRFPTSALQKGGGVKTL